MNKLFATEDWLARHPKIMLAIAVVLYVFVCSYE